MSLSIKSRFDKTLRCGFHFFVATEILPSYNTQLASSIGPSQSSSYYCFLISHLLRYLLLGWLRWFERILRLRLCKSPKRHDIRSLGAVVTSYPRDDLLPYAVYGQTLLLHAGFPRIRNFPRWDEDWGDGIKDQHQCNKLLRREKYPHFSDLE